MVKNLNQKQNQNQSKNCRLMMKINIYMLIFIINKTYFEKYVLLIYRNG